MAARGRITEPADVETGGKPHRFLLMRQKGAVPFPPPLALFPVSRGRAGDDLFSMIAFGKERLIQSVPCGAGLARRIGARVRHRLEGRQQGVSHGVVLFLQNR